MANVDRTGSPLEAAAGAADAHATEAFALLGNETRLAILLALWEEHDPHAGDDAVPFSRILDRVAYDDPGNLRYHLEKLRGQFVRQQAEGEGYELREPGMKLVRVVVAGAGVAEATLEPTEIDQACLLCGAPTAISYRDGVLLWTCTECAGIAPEAVAADGFLSATPFEPAGLDDRTPEEIRLASIAANQREKQLVFDGFCPDCSGPVDGWLEHCPDHDSDGTCDRCGHRFAVLARFQCLVCKRHDVTSPKALALFHPAVVAFYDDHGVSTRVRAGDFESARRVFEQMHDHGQEIRSEDPLRVRVTAAIDGDEVGLTFDPTASVVDVHR